MGNGWATGTKKPPSLRASPPRQAIGVIGGAILIGALAAGLYALCRSESCAVARSEEAE